MALNSDGIFSPTTNDEDESLSRTLLGNQTMEENRGLQLNINESNTDMSNVSSSPFLSQAAIGGPGESGGGVAGTELEEELRLTSPQPHTPSEDEGEEEGEEQAAAMAGPHTPAGDGYWDDDLEANFNANPSIPPAFGEDEDEEGGEEGQTPSSLLTQVQPPLTAEAGGEGENTVEGGSLALHHSAQAQEELTHGGDKPDGDNLRDEEDDGDDGSSDEEEEEDGSNDVNADESKKSRNITLFGSDSSNSSEDDEEDSSNSHGEEEEGDSKKGAAENEETEEAPPSTEEGQRKEKKGKEDAELINNIFGDDSDEEEGAEEGDKEASESGQRRGGDVDDEGEPRFIRVEHRGGSDHDDEREWDFDIMMRKKRMERSRRHRRKDGSIDLSTDSDEQLRQLVEAMTEAANEDQAANNDRRPAIRKRKMLNLVRNTLLKADLFEAMIDNGMMSAVSVWLAPLPDKSLPALEVRSTLLKILESYPQIDQSTLKQSGLGKAVMFLFKHPKETRENKNIAARLIREWSKHIFQIETDVSSMSREERVQRDLAHAPLAKRRRLGPRDLADGSGGPAPSGGGLHEGGAPGGGARALDGQPSSSRMRNAPSSKDYVIRPKHAVEGKFHSESKGPKSNRLERAQREFRERTRDRGNQRAMGVSISGKRID